MSYAPELVGGHVLLDLLNTVSWRLDSARRIDRIADPAARDVWLRAVGLPPGGDGLEEVRETAYDVLQPLAVGEEPADVEALRALMVGAVARARIVRVSPLRWQADDAAGELALAALRLLADEDLSRLRQCQDNDCGWLFLDRSKNGSRRWCSSADCGNRARAKRHYARTHTR